MLHLNHGAMLHLNHGGGRAPAVYCDDVERIARRQGATREEAEHFRPSFFFSFFFFFFIGRQGTPDGEAGLACEARITEWRTDRALCFD